MGNDDPKAVIAFIILIVIASSFILGIGTNEEDGGQGDLIIG